MTAHELAKKLMDLPDFEIHLQHAAQKGNTVYALNPTGPAVSASGLVWLGIERLYSSVPERCDA